MALFVDGPAADIKDLTEQDSGLLDVAQVNAINVTTKLRLAMEEIASDLQLWLLKPRPTLELLWGPTLRIEQVVVTPTLKYWETMHALALVYRDAYFSQLVDRYQARWQEYSKLARDARETFIATGLGLVGNPVRRAAPPTLSSIPGPQAGGTFYASVAWVNSANQEGEASEAASIAVVDSNLMVVTPPTAPSNAAGYNVFAGSTLNSMYLQNAVPLSVASSFTYIPGLVTQGSLPGRGQAPDYTRPLVRTLLRG
jgi:hypothetical protein